MRYFPRATNHLLQDFCEYDCRFYLVPQHGLNALRLSQCLNHSSDPNVSLIRPGVYRALRAIRRGRGLTLNYDRSLGENISSPKTKISSIYRSG